MYYLLTKDEYGEAYNLQEVDDEAALKAAILEAEKAGKAVKVASPLEFRIVTTIEISELAFEVPAEDPPAPAGSDDEEASERETSEG